MNKRIFTFILALAMILSFQVSIGYAKTDAIMTLDDLEGRKFAIVTGSSQDTMLQNSSYVKDYTVDYYQGVPDVVNAVRTGKDDIALVDYPVAALYCSKFDDIRMLDDAFEEDIYGFGFRKGSELTALFDEQVEILENDGTLEALEDKWLYGPDDGKILPDADWETPNGVLEAWACSYNEPMCYVGAGNTVTGYDTEVLYIICEKLGYGLNITQCTREASLMAINSGKADITFGSLSITEERKKSMDFTRPYMYSRVSIVVSKDRSEDSSDMKTLKELSGKKIATLTGSSYDGFVERSTDVVDYTLDYYNSITDEFTAVRENKADAALNDEPVAMRFCAKYPELYIIEESFGSDNYGFALQKGSPLKAIIDEQITAFKNDGTLDALKEKWLMSDDDEQLPVQDWDAPNGVINVWCAPEMEPMCYIGKNNEVIGYDIELLLLIAKNTGYKIDIKIVSFDSCLPAVSTGKTDVVCGSVSITEERKKSIDFSEPYYYGNTVAVAKHKNVEVSKGSFFDSFKNSFRSTFIVDGRWKMFVSGLMTTLIITVSSILLGTLLGFGLFMLCRKGAKVPNIIANILITVLQNTPVVVLLMIFFYIIFGSADISGVLVSIMVFSLLFASSMFSMLKMGVAAVDIGQTEAALALGYPERKTFFKIVLPQAARHFLGSYRGEVVSTIKATAIVGYIAVQDLTKVSDIVRSRTFEAFFPLICTAVLYFLFALLLSLAAKLIMRNTDPKRRSTESIMKGVKMK